MNDRLKSLYRICICSDYARICCVYDLSWISSRSYRYATSSSDSYTRKNPAYYAGNVLQHSLLRILWNHFCHIFHQKNCFFLQDSQYLEPFLSLWHLLLINMLMMKLVFFRWWKVPIRSPLLVHSFLLYSASIWKKYIRLMLSSRCLLVLGPGFLLSFFLKKRWL